VTLRDRKFPLSSAKLMNQFDGDDDASMAVNNTSAFNFRAVAGGGRISQHSFGVAIDLNPLINPYIRRSGKGTVVEPPAGRAYLNRRNVRPGMVETMIGPGKAETVVDLFAHHSFAGWGGYWRNPVDYQHFQLGRSFTAQLVRMPYNDAKAAFERHV